MCLPNVAQAVVTYNVLSFGAKGDGVKDSTGPFLKAWVLACSSTQSTTIYVPKGRYLLKNVEFRGPCKSKIKMQIDGTLVAPLDYNAVGKSRSWILFIKVNRVTVVDGTLDAKEDSPNTDGIHVQGSTGVTIKGCNKRTGDDCVSIGPGTSGLWMERIKCDPRHGVSIGSLAREYNEAGVENVTLINLVFTGSDNGLRIKSWARPSIGFVKKILFQNIVMKNTSGVKISDVTYKNIVGTLAIKVAVTFDCIPTTPCTSIMLQDVKLDYLNNAAQSLSHDISTSSGYFIVSEGVASIKTMGPCLRGVIPSYNHHHQHLLILGVFQPPARWDSFTTLSCMTYENHGDAPLLLLFGQLLLRLFADGVR
ncbi:hypothetical protein LguiA_007430 [Lonicera macranthoides]